VKQYNLKGSFAPIGDYGLLSAVIKSAEAMGKTAKVGNVLTTDAFYRDQTASVNCPMKNWQKLSVLAVEMETAGLYATAAWLGKKALSMLLVTDLVFDGEVIAAEERGERFMDMVEVALEAAIL